MKKTAMSDTESGFVYR